MFTLGRPPPYFSTIDLVENHDGDHEAQRGLSTAAPQATPRDARSAKSRERVLRLLAADGPRSTAELVAGTGLHENTVRAHLERLRADGLVRAIRDEPTGRGRPALRWHATPRQSPDSYAALATTLADALADVPEGAAIARATGERWGARLARAREGTSEGTPDDAVEPASGRRQSETGGAHDLVVDVMREQGYAPSVERDGIHLHRCPLIEAATHRPGIVCRLHEGMLQGIAGARLADACVTMTPFAPDGTCIATLQARGSRAAS